MKKFMVQALASLSLAVALLGGSARAQYEMRMFKVMLPFTFDVDGKTFPAGEYIIVRIAPDRLQLRDSQGLTVALILTHSVQAASAPSTPKLEFTTVNGDYALTQVWLENQRIGYELASPKRATVIAKNHPQASKPVAGSGNQP